MRGRRADSWWVLPILLFALFVRLDRPDAVRHEIDRAFPHGLGIAILESISDGRWADLPLLGSDTSVGAPNPVLASYGWALVAAFDRSPLIGTAVGVMLGTLGVAMVYGLALQLFGRRAALLAAVLAASSPWSVYMNRGMWLQGLLEFSAAACAWLLLPALLSRRVRARRLAASFAVGALLSHTYLLTFVVLAQMAGACLFGGRRAWRALHRPMALGLAMALASAVLYGALAVGARQAPADGLARSLEKYPVSGPSLPNPFGLRIDTTAFDGVLQVVGGRAFDGLAARDVGLAGQLAAWRHALEWRAGLVEVLLLAGIGLAAWRARRGATERLLLAWLLAPVAGSMLVALAVPKADFLEFYYLSAAPAGCILAAVPMSALIERIGRPGARRAADLLAGAAAAAACLIPAGFLGGYSDQVLRQPIATDLGYGDRLVDDVISLPLRWQPALRDAWRAQCDQLDDPMPANWLASVRETARGLSSGRAQASGRSDSWQRRPEGGDCVTRAGEPAPALAEAFPVRIGATTVATVYRSEPLTAGAQPAASPIDPAAWRQLDGAVYALSDPQPPLAVNLGWTLARLDWPDAGQAGQSLDATFVFRIDALPQEPHDEWAFDLFVQLVGPDGALAAEARAPGLPGKRWRAGDLIVSTARLEVPEGAGPGAYILRASLYDARQRKNAVWFAGSEMARPILLLEKRVAVRGAGS